MSPPRLKLMVSVVQTGRGAESFRVVVLLDTFQKLLARLEMGHVFARNSHEFLLELRRQKTVKQT